MIRTSVNIANNRGDFLGFRILKIVVAGMCIGGAGTLMGTGKPGMYETLSAVLFVMVGTGLLFGVYEGCRWCRLLSWMAWVGLPLVSLHFFFGAILSWHSEPGNIYKQGSLLNHAVRYVAPAALAVWMARVATNPGGLLEGKWARSIEVAAAATFAGHGFNAIMGSPGHVELIQGTAANLLQLEVTVGTAKQWLRGIGVMDIVLATLLVTTKWRWVAAWMAVWGLVTAFSRLTAFGVGEGWDLALVRLPNGGVPLALWCLWKMPSGEKIASPAAEMVDLKG